MRKHAFQLYSGKRRQIRRRLPRRLRQNADAPHAGIDGEMNLHRLMLTERGLAQRRASFPRKYRRRHVKGCDIIGLGARSRPQEQDWPRNPRLPQKSRFFHHRYRQIVRPHRDRLMSYGNRSVPVGVGLNDGAKFRAAGNFRLNFPDVMPECS